MKLCEKLSASKENHIDALQGVRIVPLKNIELLKLGYRIRGARKVLGYSQKVFAAKCSLDRSYLGGVERGERNVTFGVLCAICAGLKCDIAAITKSIPQLPTPVFSAIILFERGQRWIEVERSTIS